MCSTCKIMHHNCMTNVSTMSLRSYWNNFTERSTTAMATAMPFPNISFLDTHLTHPSIDRHHITSQSASGSIQRFCHSTLSGLTDQQTHRLTDGLGDRSVRILRTVAILIDSDALTTHTHTQPFYCSSGICPGPPGWAGTRKVKPGRLKPIWIYWSKR